MAPNRSIQALALSALVATTAARIAPLHKLHQPHKHEAMGLGRREIGPVGPVMMSSPPAVPAATTPAPGVIAYITPSPGASPVTVTKQSQIVTSYVPEYTLCELPPVAFYEVTPTTRPSTGPYMNYSTSWSTSIPPVSGTCTTIYSQTITMVCATTLTALADRYTVSQCAQDLTFSTEYGYVLVTPKETSTSMLELPSNSTSALRSNGTSSRSTTSDESGLRPRQATGVAATITPGPSIETLTTYFLAPWQQLTAGTAPSEVDLKVCRTFAANDTTECIREYQVWSTSLVTMTSTWVTNINISTTVHGMSQIIVETFVANVTEQLTTFSMSTTMDLEFPTEWTTTESSTRHMSTSTGPTVYETMTLELASETASENDTTSTVTLHLTSTIFAGTSTVTIPSPTAAVPSVPVVTTPASTSVNFASMLGIGRR